MRNNQQQKQQKIHLSSLRTSRIGATLLELMAMLLVLSMTLTTMFYAITQTIEFAKDTESRTKATALAREGIEALVNIRNTNWLRFSSDRTNCWNTLNYDSTCIGSKNFANIIKNGTYKLYDENALWKLEQSSGGWDKNNYGDSSEKFQIGITGSGWYTGDTTKYDSNTPCAKRTGIGKPTDCRSIFARHIDISNVTSTGFNVTSEVHWRHREPRSVKISATITNWKSLYSQ